MKFEPQNLEELDEVQPNRIGILNIPDTELESKINLLYIMMNTQQGERVMNYDFGVPFTSQTLSEQYSFSNTEAFEYYLISTLEKKIEDYFPEFTLINLESYVENNFDERTGSLIIKCLWSYIGKWKFNSISVIKPNDKMGTTFSGVEQLELSGIETTDVVSNKMITNIINNIKLQLDSGEIE